MLKPTEKDNCSELIQSCFNFHNRNGRLISTPFEELPAPSKTTYYEKIPNPIALKTVLDRLNQGAYNHLKDVYCDLKLVFSNYSQCVTKSGRDWQDCFRMDQYVDEAWEQKANENHLPPLEELFPGASHPRLDYSGRKFNPNDASSTNVSRKRSRSQSTISSGSAEEASTQANTSNQVPKSQSKRGRKNTSAAPTPVAVEEESPLTFSSKDRVHDPESGWMRDSNSHLNSQALGTFILTRLKNERLPVINTSSYSIMDPLQGALCDTTIAQDSPALKLDLIEGRLNNKLYSSVAAFDQDLHQCIVDAEKAYSQNPDKLAGILVLKRLYQELTQGDGTVALRDSIPVGEARKLASVAMGPGNPTQLPKNDDSVKLRAKDKLLLEGIRHKGDYFRVGDWIHLFNPDYPAKPIVAQIFNTYRRVDTGRRMVSVCWYYRPEETVHYISRTFIVDEVFKTGNFIEHHVEDIIGRCLVLFYTKYLRGRPTPPLWTPGMPTYICEHRYKDDVYSFKKIKNWDSCIPSNTRNESSDDNFQFFPNIQLVSSLIRVPSPFLSHSANQIKASGEPIVASPPEVKKELPKDQMKCHDLTLTLDRIRSIIGQLPTNPPRRPLKAAEHTGEESTTQQSPQLASTNLNPPHPPPSSIGYPASSSFGHHIASSIRHPSVGYAATSLIGHPATPSVGHPATSSIGHPATPPIAHPATSSIGHSANLLPSLSNYNTSQDSHNFALNLDPFLINISTNRKPYLVDILASLDQFEKLPAKIFETLEPTSTTETRAEDVTTNNEVSTGEDESSSAGNTSKKNENTNEDNNTDNNKKDKAGELIWFPCLPTSSSATTTNTTTFERSRSCDPSLDDLHSSNKKNHSSKKNRNGIRPGDSFLKHPPSHSSNMGSFFISDKLNHSQAYLDWLNKSSHS